MKLKYRPDIDGLRAIAVLSVVFYHAKFSIFNLNFLQGGFLGVDIFFVISGYLISKQIFLEIKSTKKFSFSKFYIRRVKRLIPTLVFITFLTLVLGFFILLPKPLTLFTESLIYQLGFISNFNFWHHYHFHYMAEDALRLPFLHTWSLSLEEQFYLFFPIIIIFIFNYFKKYLFLSILIGLLISLILSHYSSSIYKSLTFYMLPFRGWEFLVGTLIAYYKVFFRTNYQFNKDSTFSKILIYLSFFIILIYLFFFDSKISHPSLYTFFLIFSVGVIIWFEKNENIIIKLLSNKYLIGFGLISYSLYLWHYPLFAFARHIHGPYFENLTFLKFFIIILSIALSIFTFYFIEKPFRKKNYPIKKLLSLIILLLIFILSPSIFILKNKGFDQRLNFTDYQKQALNHKRIPIIGKDIIDNKFKDNGKKKVLIIGNSHATDFYTTLKFSKSLAKKFDINFLFTQTHCLKDIITTGKNLCQRSFNRSEIKTLNDINSFKKADILILKTKWHNESLVSLENTIDFLKTKNKKIILISDFVTFKKKAIMPYLKPEKFNKSFQQKIYYLESFPLERYILENNKFPDEAELIKIEKDYYNLIDDKIFQNNIFLEKVAKKKNIVFLDHFSLVCDKKNKSCITTTPDQKIIHQDAAGHISVSGAEYLATIIEEKEWFKVD